MPRTTKSEETDQVSKKCDGVGSVKEENLCNFIDDVTFIGDDTNIVLWNIDGEDVALCRLVEVWPSDGIPELKSVGSFSPELQDLTGEDVEFCYEFGYTIGSDRDRRLAIKQYTEYIEFECGDLRDHQDEWGWMAHILLDLRFREINQLTDDRLFALLFQDFLFPTAGNLKLCPHKRYLDLIYEIANTDILRNKHAYTEWTNEVKKVLWRMGFTVVNLQFYISVCPLLYASGTTPEGLRSIILEEGIDSPRFVGFFTQRGKDDVDNTTDAPVQPIPKDVERLRKNALRMVRAVARGYTNPFLEPPKLSESDYPQTWTTYATKRIPFPIEVEDVAILGGGCSSGKTYRVNEDFATKHSTDPSLGMLVLANRRSTVEGFRRRLLKVLPKGSKVINYITDPQDIYKLELGDCLIISPESAHKIPCHLVGCFGYVFVDESETGADQFQSPFHGSKLFWNRKIFQQLFQAKYVVLADALVTLPSGLLITEFLAKGRSIKWITSECQTFQGRKIGFRTQTAILSELKQCKDNGQSCVLISSTNSGVKHAHRVCGESEDDLYISKDFPLSEEVSEACVKRQRIYYDSKVGAGVSIDRPENPYGKRRAILQNRGCPGPKDAYQMLERVRDIADDITYISVEGICESNGVETMTELRRNVLAKAKSNKYYLDKLASLFDPTTQLLFQDGQFTFKEDDPWVKLFYLTELQSTLGEKYYPEMLGAILAKHGYRFVIDFDLLGHNTPVEFGKYASTNYTFWNVYDEDPIYCMWVLSGDGRKKIKHSNGLAFIAYLEDMQLFKKPHPNILFQEGDMVSLQNLTCGEVGEYLKTVKREAKAKNIAVYKSLPTNAEKLEEICISCPEEWEKDVTLTAEQKMAFSKRRQLARIPNAIRENITEDDLQEFLLKDKTQGDVWRLQRLASVIRKDEESVEHLTKLLNKHREKTCHMPKGINPLTILQCGLDILEVMGIAVMDREYRRLDELYSDKLRSYLVDNLEHIMGELQKINGKTLKWTKDNFLDPNPRGCSQFVATVLVHSGLTFSKAKRKREGNTRFKIKRLEPRNNVGGIGDNILKRSLEDRASRHLVDCQRVAVGEISLPIIPGLSP